MTWMSAQTLPKSNGCFIAQIWSGLCIFHSSLRLINITQARAKDLSFSLLRLINVAQSRKNVCHLLCWDLWMSPKHIEKTCHLARWGLWMLPKHVENKSLSAFIITQLLMRLQLSWENSSPSCSWGLNIEIQWKIQLLIIYVSKFNKKIDCKNKLLPLREEG